MSFWINNLSPKSSISSQARNILRLLRVIWFLFSLPGRGGSQDGRMTSTRLHKCVRTSTRKTETKRVSRSQRLHSSRLFFLASLIGCISPMSSSEHLIIEPTTMGAFYKLRWVLKRGHRVNSLLLRCRLAQPLNTAMESLVTLLQVH